ncbi:MAG TPA: tRNA (guanosine(37)-N1)-methyltransferase TrmD [Candidatus Paceibacterota bacterium]|nr:tRNA (guanosine(37)-N1)-methyltransferase TrmD [Candidatus Paceibacterota bacterium]
MNFSIITLFPEVVLPYVNASILGRAIKAKKISVTCLNPRDFTTDKHRKADERAYGGGPGMVMKAEPVLKAVQKAKGRKKSVKVLLFAPSGEMLTEEKVQTLAQKYKNLILICGHYEGIDGRVKEILKAEEISIGTYTLTGGELPALAVVDAVSRKIPGVLGNAASLEETREASPEVYTRPEVLVYGKKKYAVPKVLLSGHHEKITEWRKKKKHS